MGHTLTASLQRRITDANRTRALIKYRFEKCVRVSKTIHIFSRLIGREDNEMWKYFRALINQL